MNQANPFRSLWRRLVQGASGRVLRRQTMAPDARLGREGEEAAHWHLRNQGFIMVERNYRPQGLRGEIDLIGWEGEVLVFVEVKTRRSTVLLTPEAAVDRDKQRHLIAAAHQYRQRAKASARQIRFDIISIVMERDSATGKPSVKELSHFRDAFRAADAGGAR